MSCDKLSISGRRRWWPFHIPTFNLGKLYLSGLGLRTMGKTSRRVRLGTHLTKKTKFDLYFSLPYFALLYCHRYPGSGNKLYVYPFTPIQSRVLIRVIDSECHQHGVWIRCMSCRVASFLQATDLGCECISKRPFLLSIHLHLVFSACFHHEWFFELSRIQIRHGLSVLRK